MKSEVCYAGGIYCKVLASFNTEKSIEYLNLYLEYYLTKKDLWFDQREVMESILYLDEINGTNNFQKHYKNWLEFIQNKPNWKNEIETENTKKEIEIILNIRKYVG